MPRDWKPVARTAILGLFGALALCACRSPGMERAPAPVAADSKLAVWNALIRQAFVSDETRIVVLDPQLYWDANETSWGQKPMGVPSDAWSAFVAGIYQGGSLPRNVDPGVPVAWLGPRAFAALPPEDSSIEGRWPAFHARYPGNSGHVSISRIGFSVDGRTAVVYAFVGRGNLSASGDLYVLRRSAAGWKLVRRHNFAMA